MIHTPTKEQVPGANCRGMLNVEIEDRYESTQPSREKKEGNERRRKSSQNYSFFPESNCVTIS